MTILENTFVISDNDLKLEKMKEKFDEYKFPFPFVFRPVGSCEQSHYELLKHIKQKKLPYCTIFEDDAWPHDKSKEEIQKLDDILNEHLDEIAVVGLGAPRISSLKKDMDRLNIKNNVIDIYDDVFYHNVSSIPNANAVFLNCAEIDNRIQSILRRPLPVFWRNKNSKSYVHGYNFADRYQQSDFQRLCLYVSRPVFWHCDVAKNLFICNETNLI